MSIYQIIFLDKIPKSAAVNEAVNLSKRYGHKSSSGFTNAILRKITEEDYKEMFKIEDEIERISKTTSMPLWIIKQLLKDGLSIEKVEEICKYSNQRPKLSIRVNTLKTNKEELRKKLQEKGIEVKDGILEDFMILNKVKNIENLSEFKNGLFSIQDEAAGLTSIVLNPQKHEKILDACSAPGGKTTYLAQIVENDAKIEAWDIYEHRTKLVEEACTRLGINIIKTKVKDASIYNEENFEKFDKILLDVPCLGIGVLKRKPDIKWQKEEDNIEKIAKIQMQILDVCSKYLKNNGELVYSTCSILKEENEGIITKFLEKNPNFYIGNIELPKSLKNDKNYFEKYLTTKFLQVYQNEKTDGFFICKLVKK